MKQYRATMPNDDHIVDPADPLRRPLLHDDRKVEALLRGEEVDLPADVDWISGEEVELLDHDWNVVGTFTVQGPREMPPEEAQRHKDRGTPPRLVPRRWWHVKGKKT